jgi:hypothetical protein
MIKLHKNRFHEHPWLVRLAVFVFAFGAASFVPTFESGAQSGDGVSDKIIGTLDADGQDMIPKGTAIRVRPLSASPQMQAIAELFREKLEDMGYQGPSGHDRDRDRDHVLSFQISGDGIKDQRRSHFSCGGTAAAVAALKVWI